MKFVYFNDTRFGAVDGAGTGVVDLTETAARLPHRDRRDLVAAVIAAYDEIAPALIAATAAGPALPLADVALLPPLPAPRQIDCMAVNYMEDGTLDAPAPINAFHKSPSAVIGPGGTMALPDAPAEVFEGEAELALVIGRSATRVSREQAMDHVFGYVNFIDGSARGLPPTNNVFFQAKSRDGFAPMGPYLVTADEIADPQNLPVKLWVNDALKQDFNTNDMAHDIPTCISWVSHIHSLEPGDVLATGTNHRGLNAFQDGDRVALEIAGLGRLEIDVRDPLGRTWGRDTRLEHTEKGLPGRYTPQLTGKYAE